MNQVCLTGRLTKDVNVSQAKSGKQVLTFSVAVDGFRKDDVSFFDCVAFDKAGLVQYLVKGKEVAVSGRLQQSRWKAQDGTGRSKVEVIAERIDLIGGKAPEQPKPAPQFVEATVYDDDIPF